MDKAYAQDTLLQCFADLLQFALLAQHQPQALAGDANSVRHALDRLLTLSLETACHFHKDMRDYDQARFAICAWLDELLMAAAWTGRGSWRQYLLQNQLYHTTNAGVEFFARLAILPTAAVEVREVFYVCLAMGYTGRYNRPGDETPLRQLRQQQFVLLSEAVGGRVADFSRSACGVVGAPCLQRPASRPGWRRAAYWFMPPLLLACACLAYVFLLAPPLSEVASQGVALP